MVGARLDIQFRNTLYDQDNKTQKVMFTPVDSDQGTKYLFRSRIYVTGTDVDKIREVRYLLHPTFADPIRVATDRQKGFEILIWAWGEFDIDIVVLTHDKDEHHFTHQFRFRDQLEVAAKGDVPFEPMDVA